MIRIAYHERSEHDRWFPRNPLFALRLTPDTYSVRRLVAWAQELRIPDFFPLDTTMFVQSDMHGTGRCIIVGHPHKDIQFVQRKNVTSPVVLRGNVLTIPGPRTISFVESDRETHASHSGIMRGRRKLTIAVS